MAFNKRQGSGVVDYVKYEKASGIRMDPGPHVGIVQHVVDSTRTGRLIVFLPHLGGDPTNIDNCRIVSYASPFYGETNLSVDPANNPDTSNTFNKVRHSYGMWFTPPDVGIKVLVVFETGDTNNGYWFACIPGTGEHNNVGSVGGVKKSDTTTDSELSSVIRGYDPDFVPAVDYNSADHTKVNAAGMHSTKKPPHKIQTKILANQGLLGERHRGINNSNTTRESPSGTFGITTPGRPYTDQATDDLLMRVFNFRTDPPRTPPKTIEKVTQGRKGGHSFVMDDGDVYGESRLVRLRTAAGHQILMNDTNGMMYISNSTGNCWIELTNDGNMHIYAAKNIAVRCGGDYSLKVDGDYRLEVDGDLITRTKQRMHTECHNQTNYTQWKHKNWIGGKYELNVQKEITWNVTESINLTCGKGILAEVTEGIEITTEALTVSASGIISLTATGDTIVNGATVQLNSEPGSEIEEEARILDFGDTEQKFEEEFKEKKEDLNDTYETSGIWQYREPRTTQEFEENHTYDTLLKIIPGHEPWDGRRTADIVPIMGSRPSTGSPT